MDRLRLQVGPFGVAFYFFIYIFFFTESSPVARKVRARCFIIILK